MAKSLSPKPLVETRAEPAATTLPSGWVATANAALVLFGPTLVVRTPAVPKVGSRTPPEGTQRSSRASSRGRKRGSERLGPVRRRGRSIRTKRATTFGFCSQDKRLMTFLLCSSGLQYNENAIAAGAQTER